MLDQNGLQDDINPCWAELVCMSRIISQHEANIPLYKGLPIYLELEGKCRYCCFELPERC